MRIVLSLLALVAVATPIGAQASASSWDRYIPGRLQTVIDAHVTDVLADHSGPPADSVRVLSADDFPTRAQLRFMGEVRPIPPLKRRFLVDWLRFIGKDTATAQLYSREILFREDTTEHWLPVQDGMPEWLRENVRVGEDTEAFVMFLGALRIKGKLEWIFVVTGI